MKLIIGDKRFSSWSLRPWLLLSHFEIAFEEILIRLNRDNTREQILRFSPSGKVPALIDGDLVLWESLAIAEYLNEKFPTKKMWPESLKARAEARVVSSEMAASFATLRKHMPHDVKNEFKDFDWSPAEADITRVKEIWTQCLKKSGGPFLFGGFSIADAMYAPVVNRFVTYGVPMEDDACRAYIKTMRGLPAHQRWIQQGQIED